MTAADRLLRIHDLDLLSLELGDPGSAARIERAGFRTAAPRRVESERSRLVDGLDPRWRQHYERALRRYGSGIAAVRGRVCQGCFVTLPRSASAGIEDRVSMCEACGRILFWGPPVGRDPD